VGAGGFLFGLGSGQSVATVGQAAMSALGGFSYPDTWNMRPVQPAVIGAIRIVELEQSAQVNVPLAPGANFTITQTGGGTARDTRLCLNIAQNATPVACWLDYCAAALIETMQIRSVVNNTMLFDGQNYNVKAVFQAKLIDARWRNFWGVQCYAMDMVQNAGGWNTEANVAKLYWYGGDSTSTPTTFKYLEIPLYTLIQPSTDLLLLSRFTYNYHFKLAQTQACVTSGYGGGGVAPQGYVIEATSIKLKWTAIMPEDESVFLDKLSNTPDTLMTSVLDWQGYDASGLSIVNTTPQATFTLPFAPRSSAQLLAVVFVSSTVRDSATDASLSKYGRPYIKSWNVKRGNLVFPTDKRAAFFSSGDIVLQQKRAFAANLLTRSMHDLSDEWLPPNVSNFDGSFGTGTSYDFALLQPLGGLLSQSGMAIGGDQAPLQLEIQFDLSTSTNGLDGDSYVARCFLVSDARWAYGSDGAVATLE
jgi:hypothetical protein